MRSISILLILVLVPTGALAKDYSVPLVVIDATILADGSVVYEEHRTYRFDGSFTEADYRLSRDGFDRVVQMAVREGGTPLRLDESGAQGTYRIRETDEEISIIWNYRATNEERTFTISYVLEGAVLRGPDHAEFFWTYLSDRWERGTGELEVNLHFEQSIDPQTLHHFVRGAGSRAAVVARPDGFHVSGRDFSRTEFLAMRAVFPARLVPELPVSHPDLTLERIVADEQRRAAAAEEARARRDRQEDLWQRIAVYLAVLSAAAFGGLYRRYRRNRPGVEEDIPQMLFEPPLPHPPAVADGILTPALGGSGRHLVGTLFEFCTRRYYRIVQGEPVRKLFGSTKIEFEVQSGDVAPETSEMPAWEAAMVDLIEASLRAGDTTIKKIFDLSRGDRAKWFSGWQKLLKAEVASLNLYHPENRTAVSMNLLIQIPVVMASIPALGIAGPWGLLPLFAGGAALSMTNVLRHRTPEGEVIVRKWKAYRSALQDADPEQLAGSMDIHFPFAVAFGLTGKRTELLVSSASSHAFLWLTTMSGHPISPAHLTEAVTTMTTSVSSTVSTGTGATVGAAGGGAGGGAR